MRDSSMEMHDLESNMESQVFSSNRQGYGDLERRKRLSTCKVVLIFVALVAFLLIGVAVGRGRAKAAQGSAEVATCQTEGCVQLAAMLLDNMDRTADPCEDFYQYMCGGWMETHQIPDDKASYDTFTILDEQNQQVLRTVLERAPGPDDDALATASQTAHTHTHTHTHDALASRTFYQSCLDLTVIDALGATPVLQLLTALDWQPTADRAWTATDILALRERLQLLNPWRLQPLFYMGTGADPMDSERHVVFIGQAGLGLNKDQFKNTTAQPFQAYKTLLTTLFGLVNLSQAASADVAARVVEFERELSLTFLAPEERRDPVKSYNPQTFASLSDLAPFLDWEAYFTSVWSGAELATLNDGTSLVLESPSYLNNMSRIVTNTSKQTVVEYLQARVLTSWASRLSRPFRDANFEFRKALYGVQQERPRWKTCLDLTDGALGFALGRDFVHYTKAQDDRAAAQDMIGRIRTAFEQQLVPALSWMDSPTKAAAVEKAQAVGEQIGYPDWIMNQTRLQEYYHGLQAVPGQFAESIKSVLRWTFEKDVADLAKPVDKTEWYMTPPEVNAYYDPSTNQMAFPAGILRPPFFKASWPKAFNYGAIGAVMGHELTHGFDDEGSQYDKTGNLDDWWSNSSRSAFEERTTCMIEQYSKYQLHDKNVNGLLTLGENIADNGGIKEALMAYQAYIKDSGPEKPLPALGLSSHQLFYAGFATVWCGKARQEAEMTSISTDPHSPRKFRVIGSMSNSQDFAAAFKCPPGSPMVNDPSCEVW